MYSILYICLCVCLSTLPSGRFRPPVRSFPSNRPYNISVRSFPSTRPYISVRSFPSIRPYISVRNSECPSVFLYNKNTYFVSCVYTQCQNDIIPTQAFNCCVSVLFVIQHISRRQLPSEGKISHPSYTTVIINPLIF